MQNAVAPSTVSELGEHEVLRRILRHYRGSDQALVGPGDDCAVLEMRGDTVVTTDTMIEGPDFRLAWHNGYELGWKLAATNLSDVAAMGADPVGLTVALACPGDTPIELLEDIARGLNAACVELAPGCGVVGGDLGRAPVLMASITALGNMNGRAPVVRSGARPGDIIAYAGPLGLAGMGLSLLFAESADSDGIAHSGALASIRERHPAALRAQLTPTPPVALGARAADEKATAMLDVSDGLAIDAARIARASGVCVNLSAALLEQSFGQQDGERVSLEALLYGGEDHGLLATFPADTLLPVGFFAIGSVHAAELSAAEARASEANTAAGAKPQRGHELLLNGEPCEIRGWDPFTVRPPGS